MFSIPNMMTSVEVGRRAREAQGSKNRTHRREPFSER
jgi:hypothetical protein